MDSVACLSGCLVRKRHLIGPDPVGFLEDSHAVQTCPPARRVELTTSDRKAAGISRERGCRRHRRPLARAEKVLSVRASRTSHGLGSGRGRSRVRPRRPI